MSRLITTLVVLLAIIAFEVVPTSASRAKVKPGSSPIADDAPLLRFINSILPDSTYCCILSALDPERKGPTETALLFHTIRIVCPDLSSLQQAVRALKDCKEIKIKKLRHDIEKARSSDPTGYRGIIVRLVWQDQEKHIQLLTFQQLRWLLWANEVLPNDPKAETKADRSYAKAVSDYLDAIDLGELSSAIPCASDFGLAQRVELYPPLTNDEIAFTDSVAEITTSFAHGITAFAATDSLLDQFKFLASNQAFIDNDPAMFQWQCREFFSSSQTLADIKTLSPENFQQLEPGEYAFAIDIDGTFRLVKVAEPNIHRWSRLPHALLFCNQEVLTSGNFVIERDPAARFSRVNIRSHAILGELITQIESRLLSDQRLTSLGHFFQTLDRLGITYHGIIISKF